MYDLYNVEVEHCHTYFVGKGNGSSVLVHNGDANYISKLQRMEDGTPIPRGFKSEAEYKAFVAKLRAGLPEGVEPVFQGSAVTGKSFRTGKAFDVGRTSDFDIGLAGEGLFGKASDAASSIGLRVKDGSRIGPFTAKNPAASDAVNLRSLQAELSTMAGRDVNFMIYDSLPTANRRPVALDSWVRRLTMSTTDLYGFKGKDIESIRAKLERTLGFSFDAHESSYVSEGDYYAKKVSERRHYGLQFNFDSLEHDWAEEDHKDMDVLLYVGCAENADEIKTRLLGVEGISHLRRVTVTDERRVIRKDYSNGQEVLVCDKQLD